MAKVFGHSAQIFKYLIFSLLQLVFTPHSTPHNFGHFGQIKMGFRLLLPDLL